MSKLDELRVAVAKVDALAAASETLFDNTQWHGDVDRQRIERAANLIGLTREAAEAAVLAVDAFHADALSLASRSSTDILGGTNGEIV